MEKYSKHKKKSINIYVHIEYILISVEKYIGTGKKTKDKTKFPF